MSRCSRILMKDLLQSSKEFRVFFLKQIGTFEEIFRNHGKKLGFIGYAVWIDIGMVGFNVINALVNQLKPGFNMAFFEQVLRKPIGSTIDFIEQVNKLVNPRISFTGFIDKSFMERRFRENHCAF
jgi:hypothetical protein